MKEISTSIEINASPERVWQVLTNFAEFSRWNPFMKISGSLKEGAVLDVSLSPPGGKVMKFRPTLLKVQADQELRWLGKLLVSGVFDGEHKLHIETLEQNHVRFTQSEQFRGFLVPLFARSLDGGTKSGFEEMNKALKKEAEQPA